MLCERKQTGDKELTAELLSCFPDRLREELYAVCAEKVDELRLRYMGSCSYVTDGKSFGLKTVLSRNETDAVIARLCGGSLYAHADTISKGYITVFNGIRVGVVGRAVTDNGKITGVYDISSLCIRIPHEVTDIGDPIVRLLKSTSYSEGILIYSLPGVGKSTLLRSVITSLAGGSEPKRVAVIDTRGELGSRLPPGLHADILTGYPKGLGIEIAASTLNPQLIVCDEISAESNDAASIKAAHNCGVPLLATAHAKDVRGLLNRSGVRLLHDAGIFGRYVGITRSNGNDYNYTVTSAGRAYVD